MAKEEKDALFSVSLDDGLIEIPDKVEEKETPNSTEKKKGKEKEKIDEGITLHPDGMIEIDEFSEEKRKASELESTEDDDEEENDDDNKTFIDKKNKTKGKETPSETKKPSDSSPSSSSPYLAFARDRVEQGVFLDFTEEQWGELVERNEGDEAGALRELHSLSMQAMIEQEVERYKESLTPEERTLYEAKEKGVPLDKYSVAKRNYDKYSKITPESLKENEKLQEEVVTKLLESRGYTAEEIKEEVEGYKALEVLESKATKALELVPKAFKKEIDDLDSAARADEESKKQRAAQRVAKMKNLIDTTLEIVPGIKLNKSVKEELMGSMSTPVARDEEGNPLNAVMVTRAKNPEAFEMMVHYYHKLGLFNIDKSGKIDPDFSKILTVAKTKAVDSMRTVFESKENTSKGKVNIKTKNEDDDDYDKAWSRLGKI